MFAVYSLIFGGLAAYAGEEFKTQVNLYASITPKQNSLYTLHATYRSTVFT
jgi:hypothetical protein